jgi:hypothetical protein
VDYLTLERRMTQAIDQRPYAIYWWPTLEFVLMILYHIVMYTWQIGACTLRAMSKKRDAAEESMANVFSDESSYIECVEFS